MKLEIEYLPLSEINGYEGNAKMHPAQQIEQIAASIAELGFNDPIAIWGENNTIVEGHGRVLAAFKLGLDTVPVIRLDGLTDEQRRAYALIHNQLTMNSGFDAERLQVELDGITEINMEQFDFTIPEMDGEMFSMDDMEVVPGFTAKEDTREFFESAFTFPTIYKTAIVSYLAKNKARITQQIIEEACKHIEPS